jgi:hypothetical protein
MTYNGKKRLRISGTRNMPEMRWSRNVWTKRKWRITPKEGGRRGNWVGIGKREYVTGRGAGEEW